MEIRSPPRRARRSDRTAHDSPADTPRPPRNPEPRWSARSARTAPRDGSPNRLPGAAANNCEPRLRQQRGEPLRLLPPVMRAPPAPDDRHPVQIPRLQRFPRTYNTGGGSPITFRISGYASSSMQTSETPPALARTSSPSTCSAARRSASEIACDLFGPIPSTDRSNNTFAAQAASALPATSTRREVRIGPMPSVSGELKPMGQSHCA